VLAREAAAAALLELVADPILQIADRITADAKLDEMQGHEGNCRTASEEIKQARCG
jgi:hypothetical protein